MAFIFSRLCGRKPEDIAKTNNLKWSFGRVWHKLGTASKTCEHGKYALGIFNQIIR